MTIEGSLLTNSPYLELPQGILGWIGWLAYFGLLVYLLWRWRAYNKRWDRLQWGIFLGLALLLPLTSLFMVLRLPPAGILPPPDRPVDPLGPAAVVFSSLPWMLAAGLLGTLPAAGLGLASGLMIALFETHNPFTILTIAIWGVLMGAAFQQRYRTRPFRLIRHPLAATVLLLLAYPAFFIFENLLMVTGSLASRIDYLFSWLGSAWAAVAIEFLVVGLLVEVVAQAFPALWGSGSTLQPSPVEKRLQNRFFASLIPLVFLLLVALIISNWVVAGNAAERMLEDRLGSTADMAAQSVPNFLETGQNLIQQLAEDNLWYEGSPEQVSGLLSESLRAVPFFHEIYLLDAEGEPLDGVSAQNFLVASPTPEEYFGIGLALNGVPYQSYTIAPASDGVAARMSFFASIYDDEMQLRGVLIGRTDLASNPSIQPALSSLESLETIDGEGMLIDGDERIIYNSSQNGTMEEFSGQIGEEAMFYEETAPDGTRSLVYTQPVAGSSWTVATTVPARQAQEIALEIAAPLSVILVSVFAVAAVMLRFSLRGVTASLSKLTLEANRLSSGQLDRPLQVDGEDEVGQLRRAFEQMRASLKARLDELNRLVVVSQGVAASLEFEEAVKPVLEAALSTGASSARVVLSPDVFPDAPGSSVPATRFGTGPAGELYAGLDEQVLGLARQQERVALTNLPRVRLLNYPQGSPRPESILALPLRHENLYYGTLWLAYDTPHQFPDDEVRFITTLASQAALASANSRLFTRAEVGRQRLASILSSTPDPVLVTDHRDRLLLANPAAWHVLGLGVEAGQGQPIEQVISNTDLVRLLRTFSNDHLSAEVTLPDGKIYLAIASSVTLDGHPVGRICILRDITHFKELDAMKSDFVSTVSHDLRSPLTLMRGYATMLEMVGDLNEQQTSYVRKIVTSVEGMSRLVNTLLDLGRIEAGVDLQLEMVSVHDIIDRVVGSIQLQATQKQIVISTEIDSQAAPLVEADQALLQQALHNLIENAIKYTEPGGKVSIRVAPDQERILFEVSDTGIGIAPVDLPRLFEKFYRGGQREAKKRQGTGLGLAIVKSIAERHNGEVWAESQLGKGSKFSFAIPVHQQVRERQG
jgi:PAS domain S-box-containing protein